MADAKYAISVLELIGMENCRSMSTPMGDYKTWPDNSKDSTDDIERPSKFPYRKAIGSLMYIMIGTSPDLAFAVGKLSQFCESPIFEHCTAVKLL